MTNVAFPYINEADEFGATASVESRRIIPDNPDDYLKICNPEKPGYIQNFKYESVWIKDTINIANLVIANANTVWLSRQVAAGSMTVVPLKQTRFKSCEIACPSSNANPISVTLAEGSNSMIIEPGATLKLPLNNNQVVPPFVISYEDGDSYNLITSPEYNSDNNAYPVAVADVEFTVNGADFDFFVIGGNGDVVINWGDGTSDTYIDPDEVEAHHTYAETGQYHIKILSGIYRVTIDGENWGHNSDYLISVDKVTNLNQLYISSNNNLESIDISEWTPIDEYTTLEINGNNILNQPIDFSVLNPIQVLKFKSNPLFNQPVDFGFLSNTSNTPEIDIRNSRFSVSEINAALITLDNTGVVNGFFHSENQTPAAAPTGAGATAAANLVSNGWTVTTD